MKHNSDNMQLLRCSMDTCVYYVKATGLGSGMAYCKHPDKDIVRQSGPCPLYKLDWQKQLNNIKLKKN